MSMEWITDHALIDGDATYIVFAIGMKQDKSGTYLYNPQVCRGWQFKQSLAGCYAVILMPEWKGLEPTGGNT